VYFAVRETAIPSTDGFIYFVRGYRVLGIKIPLPGTGNVPTMTGSFKAQRQRIRTPHRRRNAWKAEVHRSCSRRSTSAGRYDPMKRAQQEIYENV